VTAADPLAEVDKRVAAALARDRQLLQRGLHDGVQQRLSAIRIRLAVAGELAGADRALREMLDEIADSVEAAIDELRDVLQGVYPPVLADRGLVAALTHVAGAAAGPVSVVGPGVGRHPAEVEAAIYYCCREAMQNAAKHAGPSVRVSISLHEDAHELAFDVADDGTGFDATRLPIGGSLLYMGHRIRALGGHFSIASHPAEGTVMPSS
jgi:signal transduction histidine kinase